jgi:uncharacterized protein YbjT (DUF2867 family)
MSNNKIRIILTGSTGFVGEGILFECLAHEDVEEVLIVNRRHYEGKIHPKLKECIVRDFFNLDEVEEQLKGYDACFYCAGKSSVGMNEQDYTHLTYDMALYFANKLLSINPEIVFCHISGASSDSSENGKVMWARVKGKIENKLLTLPFKKVYNFRPGIMKATKGQKNSGFFYQAMYPIIHFLAPKHACTLHEVGLAMIKSVFNDYSKQILEVVDIVELAKL